jgi:hypothetical protein
MNLKSYPDEIKIPIMSVQFYNKTAITYYLKIKSNLITIKIKPNLLNLKHDINL